ncbi:hypothetical protein ABFG93_07775 [Pseudalkalibacillus hwajinpoensis]|uniref:hypothetical protein n=1 Tax=Guptibacillus hwajinpoensis TaxID=208199 RepID=UPI00325A539B
MASPILITNCERIMIQMLGTVPMKAIVMNIVVSRNCETNVLTLFGILNYSSRDNKASNHHHFSCKNVCNHNGSGKKHVKQD